MRVKTSVEIMKDRNSHLCLVCLKLTIFCSKIPPGGLKYQYSYLCNWLNRRRYKDRAAVVPLVRGEICPSRQSRRECKIFASGVNFSIFTHFLCFFLLKLLKLGEIDGVRFLAWKSGGVKFWTNSMSEQSVCRLGKKWRHSWSSSVTIVGHWV